MRQLTYLRSALMLYLAILGAATCSTPVNAQSVRFAGKLTGGDKSINVQGDNGASVTVYQFDGGYQPDSTPKSCSADDLGNGTIVQVPASGSNQTSQLSTTLNSGDTQSIALSTALLPNTQLCLQETPTPPGSPAVYSTFQTVSDPNAYKLARTYYTVGAIISNQTSTNGSSTAAQYIDIGFAPTYKAENPAGKGLDRIGMGSFISGRFSSIPVAAPATGDNSSAASNTLNILSSQQSARVMGGFFLPYATHSSSDHNYSFIIAPIIKAGIETLLNPSASTTTGDSSATTNNASRQARPADSTTTTNATITAAAFSSVYQEFSGGLRFALRSYSKQKDYPPQPWLQADITIGKYANLQSYVCGSKTTFSATAPTNTSCFTAGTSNGAAGYFVASQNRITLPRAEVQAFARFPNSPFVIGLDANLPQDKIDHAKNLDILNKAGGDVSIYFGVSGNLGTLFKSLNLSGQN